LDLDQEAPTGHPLADVWDCLQWLAQNRAARRPPDDFPQVLWGAPPMLWSQPEPFFDGHAREALADLWSDLSREEKVAHAQRLLCAGVRTAQLVDVFGEQEALFRGVIDAFGLRQKTGPAPTATQLFRRRPQASQANTFMDSVRKRFHGAALGDIDRLVKEFVYCVGEYDQVVDNARCKLDASAAWAVLLAFLENEIEMRVCHDVLQLYWSRRDHSTRASPFMPDPVEGVTAADRVRFYVQYSVVARPD
jgi:hypothetical protein